jgi:PPK2 family polyphosphate:nucleotide phosphotransferase
VKIRTNDFRVREGDDVKLYKLPTVTDPIYVSIEDYQDLLAKHVLQLSAL